MKTLSDYNLSVDDSRAVNALLIKKNGKTIIKEAKGCGRFDKREGKCILSVDNKTPLPIASVSKHFTVALVLMLEEEGLLDIEDSITKYLNFPDRFNNIKIKHLIFNTSGISNHFLEFKILDTVAAKQVVTSDDIMEFIKRSDLEEPGVKFRYSNSGFHLLGKIIESVSSKSFEDFARERIFVRLGMQNAMFGTEMHNNKNCARVYAKFPKEEDMLLDLYSLNAEGGILLSLDDYERWIDAFSENRIFKKIETMNKFLSDGYVNNGKLNYVGRDESVMLNGEHFPPLTETANYGFGMFKLNSVLYNNMQYDALHHSGGFMNAISDFIYIPKENLWVVVISNETIMNARAHEIIANNKF